MILITADYDKYLIGQKKGNNPKTFLSLGEIGSGKTSKSQ